MSGDKRAEKVKILVACHQPCFLPNESIFVPVHGGRALRRNTQDEFTRKWLEESTIGDDTGISISKKNGRYNEMTVIYWAWKNYELLGDPEYIGFMHYRRHFIFDEWKKPKGNEWFFRVPFLGEELEKFTGMNRENIYACIGEHDLLYPRYPLNISVYDQYKKSPYHRIEDLQLVLSIIKERHQDYYPYAQSYISGNEQIYCNMFIMRKEYFFEYCQWIFSVLAEFDKRRDYRFLTKEEARFFVSERLTGIFIHRKLVEGANAKPISIALLENPHLQNPTPAFPENNIPIVFATDDTYLPVLGVALQSLAAASSPDHNYDIFVLHEGLYKPNMQLLREVLEGRKNFSLRFMDVRPYFDESVRKALFVSKGLPHISFATYYRFVIGRIFPHYEKILYLDCDIIINDDVSTLYATELGGKWIAAVPDMRERIAIHRNLKVDGRLFGDYVNQELGVDENQYFQAGVLLYNIKRFKEDGVETLLFAKAKELDHPILMDQDILNSVCKGHVHYLPVRWNVEWQIGFEFEDFSKELSFSNSVIYSKARKNPAIVHYASPVKPWDCPPRPFSALWWEHAAKTPWYEYFLTRFASDIKAFAKRRKRERLMKQNAEMITNSLRAKIRLKFSQKKV